MTEAIKLLDAVVRDGSDAVLSAFAASGRDGLLVLRRELSRRWGYGDRWRDVSGPQVIDAINAASAEVARANPVDFLDVFADRRFDRNGYVLTGLGEIDDARATERLARASAARGLFGSETRMTAAIGLGRRHSDLAIDTLIRLLRDRSDLVRYHALRSLGSIGDVRALSALTAFKGPPFERDLADHAIQIIEDRERLERPRDIQRR